MNWPEKYKSHIEAKKSSIFNKDGSQRNEYFEIYSKAVNSLFNEIKNITSGTGILIKTQKVKISPELSEILTGEKKEIDSLILSDNDFEIRFVPEGITFIGVYGRLNIKAYKKVTTLQAIIEKKIKYLKEPYLFLIRNFSKENDYTWGYIPQEATLQKEIIKIDNSLLENILEEVFITE